MISKERVTLANGKTEEVLIVNIRSIQIGELKVTDVKGLVSTNLEAPLLLGQTVLEKFGKVTFDYNNKQIIIER